MRIRGLDSRRVLTSGLGRRMGNGSILEELSESALVYTRDCPAYVFYDSSETSFTANEKAYITINGRRCYLVEDASTQLFTDDDDGSAAEWLPFQLGFDANLNPQKWIPPATTNLHFNRNQVSVDGSSFYTLSCIVKAGELDKFRMTPQGAYFVSSPTTEFDLALGTITTESACTAWITPIGNGKYCCSMSMQSDVAGACYFQPALMDNDGNVTFLGDGSSGIYWYGAKCEKLPYPSSFHRGTEGVRVATNAYWDSADVKPWVYNGRWDFLWVPNFDSAVKDTTGTTKAVLYNPLNNTSSYMRYTDTDKFEIRDAATGVCVQSAAITCDRYDVFQFIINYPTASLTVIKNGTTYGPYTGTQWVWSGDLQMGHYSSAGYACEGFISVPRKA